MSRPQRFGKPLRTGPEFIWITVLCHITTKLLILLDSLILVILYKSMSYVKYDKINKPSFFKKLGF
jgi:hypothetical protein